MDKVPQIQFPHLQIEARMTAPSSVIPLAPTGARENLSHRMDPSRPLSLTCNLGARFYLRFLQIKGTALPFCQAQKRSQPPRGTHQRPAEGGGDPGEEGKAVTGPRPPRPVPRGHGAEERGAPRGHGPQHLTGGRPCMCAKYLGVTF